MPAPFVRNTHYITATLSRQGPPSRASRISIAGPERVRPSFQVWAMKRHGPAVKAPACYRWRIAVALVAAECRTSGPAQAIEPPRLIGSRLLAVGGLELSAGDPERAIGKRPVHIVAVVRQSLPGVGFGPKKSAVHARAGDLDAPALLKRENQLNQQPLQPDQI